MKTSTSQIDDYVLVINQLLSAEGRVENQKLVWLSFWFSTRFTRETFDQSGGSYLYSAIDDKVCEQIFQAVFFW